MDPYWVSNKDDGAMMTRRFEPDGRLTAPRNDPLQGGEAPMRWRFVEGGIQVEQYPTLVPKRRADWGFQLENQWVVFLADLKEGGEHAHGVSRSSASLPRAERS